MKRLLVYLMVCASIAACAQDAGEVPWAPAVSQCDPVAAPASEALQWKRARAFINDLERALELPADKLCVELDQLPCADLHRVPLGGSEPMEAALYTPAARPLVTTPTVMERVVLAGCANRVTREAEADSESAVFSHLDLAAAQVDAEDSGVPQQITALYRRFLSRDPTAMEIDTVAELTVGANGEPVSARTFAKLACFAIGTTTEFALF